MLTLTGSGAGGLSFTEGDSPEHHVEGAAEVFDGAKRLRPENCKAGSFIYIDTAGIPVRYSIISRQSAMWAFPPLCLKMDVFLLIRRMRA